MDDMIEMRLKDLEERVHALEEERRKGLWGGEDSHTRSLINRYGETVDKTVAAKILSVTRATIYAMLEDGRINAACEGRRVSVRSIARYINRKEKENQRAS